MVTAETAPYIAPRMGSVHPLADPVRSRYR